MRIVIRKKEKHTLHDVVTVCAETDGNAKSQDGELPHRHGRLGGSGCASGPGGVNGSPGTDRVTNVVGTVSERSSASSDDLNERVGVLDLVGVLLRSGVDALHALTLGSTVDTTLGRVNIVVETVQETDSDNGRKALEHALHVAELVNLTGAHRVVAQETHGPAQRAAALEELGVVAGFGLGHELAVRELVGLELLDGPAVGGAGDRGNSGLDFLLVNVDVALVFGLILHDGVVGHLGGLAFGGDGTAEEEGTENDVVPLDGGISLDDTGVQPRDEEEGGQKADTTTSTHGDSDDVRGRLLAQTQVG